MMFTVQGSVIPSSLRLSCNVANNDDVQCFVAGLSIQM